MDVEVLHAGMFTTVQDLGRSHYQQYGVPVGGAMDQSALRMINMLVGNEENEAGLEMTIMGPKLLIKESDFTCDWRSKYGAVTEWEAYSIMASHFSGRR